MATNILPVVKTGSDINIFRCFVAMQFREDSPSVIAISGRLRFMSIRPSSIATTIPITKLIILSIFYVAIRCELVCILYYKHHTSGRGNISCNIIVFIPDA